MDPTKQRKDGAKRKRKEGNGVPKLEHIGMTEVYIDMSEI